jgi:hypothetical protein
MSEDGEGVEVGEVEVEGGLVVTSQFSLVP